MTRVLVIEPAGNLRGSERALLALLKGSTLTMAVCCPPETPLAAELHGQGFRVLPYFIADLHRKSKWQRLRAALGVLRAGWEFRPDVIYLNQSGAYKVTELAARLLRLSVVAHIRLFEEIDYLARQRIGRGRLAALIAVSDAVKQRAVEIPVLAKTPSFRIYDAYAAAPDNNETSVGRIANRVVCIGAIEKDKGQDILLAAMAKLGDRKSAAECCFAGEGDPDYVRPLQTAAAANIRWLGFVSDVVPLLRSAAVLAVPSHRETLGRVILEAWDAGAVPVVYAGSGGAAEIVAASGGGIIYDRQTPAALAAALQKALALGEAERQNLIGNGRDWLARNCDPQRCAAAVAAILTRAAQR